MVEFHEEQPHYKRKLLSQSLLEHAKDIIVKLEMMDLATIDVSSSSSSYGSTLNRSLGDSENDALSQSKKKKEAEIVNQKHVATCETISKTLSTEFSWFSIMWTCQKKQTLRKEESNQNSQQLNNQQNADQSNVQFLVFYKFGAGSSGL